MKMHTRQNRTWGIIALCMILTLTLFATLSKAQAESNGPEASFSEAELAQMLAPIALYPDSLLTHILIASTYPLEIVQAKRLQSKNKLLPTAQLMEKAEDEDWDPSVTALLAFPTVLDKLSEDLEWTQDLGDAFLQDEERMLASIQTLRHQADEANSLAEMENMSVSRVDNQIIIEPVQKEIIYVPYYDPRVVYGHWAWYNYPPVYWAPYPYYVRPPYGHFYWHSGVHISFNYYFSAFHWHQRHVVVVHHKNARHYRHHGRIVTSHGAQRWQHKPAHRRGVAYRSPAVKHRYQSHRPSTLYSKQVRQADRHAIKHSSTNNKLHSKSIHTTRATRVNNLSHYNKQIAKQREQKFANQMHHKRNMQASDRGVNKHKVGRQDLSKHKANYDKRHVQTQKKLIRSSTKPTQYKQAQNNSTHKKSDKTPNYSQQNKASHTRTQQTTRQPSHSGQMRSSTQMRNSGQTHSKAHHQSSNSHKSNGRTHSKQRD
ncbi:conserved protein of unknown function [Shewanella benthica]|uniref:DUF3300 domain-containing protein n=1 Tax=Shewanella benthica TaxID=43661 RepID=A0A330M8R0_9GAMM|nr:DUF3300 domain-containing protein [Shewanella benthica]SQH77833.1 conserved protein of unknown function [Shewanella benthica]